MFGRLLPREGGFFDFFDRHATKTLEGAREFLALASGKNPDVVAAAKRIKEIEHETDVITHHCVELLHKTFITPLERDDIHRLITRMDDIMDTIEEAAERLALYEIRVMTQPLEALASILVRSTEEVQRAVRGLRNMKNAEAIIKSCIEINRMENEADGVFRSTVADLFKNERDPIAVIKWKEIYESLEAATDRCEDVANIIEGVVLEHA